MNKVFLYYSQRCDFTNGNFATLFYLSELIKLNLYITFIYILEKGMRNIKFSRYIVV